MLDQNAWRRQTQRARGAGEEAAGADNPAFELVGDQFQAIAEVGDIFDGIDEAGAKFERTEDEWIWRNGVDRPDQRKVPACQQNRLSYCQTMLQARCQQRTED